MGKAEENITRQNILRKRKLYAQKRRRAFLKLIAFLTLLAAILAVLIFLGYTLVSFGSRIYRDYQTMYDGYAARQQAKRGDVDAKFDGYTNILVMGIDNGADESEDSGKRADTIIVISLNNNTGKASFINIPRDTWVTVPNTNTGTRLKSIYAMGGSPLMVREVNSLLGISIHQYIALDMQTFADLIDILGGIDLYVEGNMVYEDSEAGLNINLSQGYQHLDGETAQKYLRYRSPELGDIGRAKRQQKFIKALYQEVLQLKTVPKLPQIAEVFQSRVETSAEIFDAAHLANVLRQMSSDIPESLILPGAPSENDDTIWIPDKMEIDKRMQELFPADTLITTEEETK